MLDFWQRHGSVILIGATIVYLLSLIFWLMWIGALLLGAGYGSLFLTILAGITALLYPVVIIGGLFAGWRFHGQNQFKKSFWAVFIPLLYIPLMLIVGFVALVEGM